VHQYIRFATYIQVAFDTSHLELHDFSHASMLPLQASMMINLRQSCYLPALRSICTLYTFLYVALNFIGIAVLIDIFNDRQTVTIDHGFPSEGNWRSGKREVDGNLADVPPVIVSGNHDLLQVLRKDRYIVLRTDHMQ